MQSKSVALPSPPSSSSTSLPPSLYAISWCLAGFDDVRDTVSRRRGRLLGCSRIHGQLATVLSLARVETCKPDHPSRAFWDIEDARLPANPPVVGFDRSRERHSRIGVI